jgi:hypothetical protein
MLIDFDSKKDDGFNEFVDAKLNSNDEFTEFTSAPKSVD